MDSFNTLLITIIKLLNYTSGWPNYSEIFVYYSCCHHTVTIYMSLLVRQDLNQETLNKISLNMRTKNGKYTLR